MRSLCILAAILAVPIALAGQRLQITVTNPSDVDRKNEPIVLRWGDLGKDFPAGQSTELRLSDEQGRPVEFQVDDLTCDGIPDELAFQDDFAPGESKHYVLEDLQHARPPVDHKPRTDAQDWKRINGVLQSIDDDNVPGNGRERGAYRFDGVGWESESMAYRLYLDARNAVDLLGKRTRGLYWKWIGTSGTDYQADADWGMDILHIGSALGVGGIGFWSGDSVVKPISLEHQRTRILARGPVRAVVRVDYQGWNIGSDTVDLTSTFIIYAGDRSCEHRVEITRSATSTTLAIGIVRKDSTAVVWDPQHGWLYTTGRQSRANDSLMMALVVSPPAVLQQTEGKDDHLLLLHASVGTPLRIFLSACWQGESGRMWKESEIRDHLNSITRRMADPLTMTYSHD